MDYNNNGFRTSLAKFDSGARCLQILGHPVRLRLLKMLSGGEWSVNELALELGISQSNLSQHLTLLKDRGIIVSRREGHQVFYGISDRRVHDFLELMEVLFCRDVYAGGKENP